ncbi:MAG: hypothetical protein D6782_11285, partial [Alphaproteobacteria bacterium]
MPIPKAALRVPQGAAFPEQRLKILSVDPARRRIGQADPINRHADLGLPLGGLGTGAMVWSRLGGFTRWSLKTGYYQHFREPACGFAVRAQAAGQAPWARALQPPPEDARQLGGWDWLQADRSGDYAALFPKAWRHYAPAGAPVRIACEAFSPVIPGDLDAACLPVALFRWRLTNTTDAPVSAAVMAHWANLCGWFTDERDARPVRRGGGAFNAAVALEADAGVVFDRLRRGPALREGEGQFALLARAGAGQRLSHAAMVNGLGDGAAVWQAFSTDGAIADTGAPWIADAGFRVEDNALAMGAVCLAADLAPGESRDFPFALAWDFPVVEFGLGGRFHRAYTAAWGGAGGAAAAMAAHALARADDWSAAIDRWHESVAADLGAAPWQAGYALNELYFMSDGCTVLSAPDASGHAHFGLLECPDYPYYNTLDLWVYASEAVLRHWPGLERLVLDDYARTLTHQDGRLRKALHGERRFACKRAGYLPHDLGAPEEAPFDLVNSYTLQDSTRWKDLNSQFVLALWRAGLMLGRDWLRGHYEAAQAAIAALVPFDRDGDGLIENDGFPDQTFDNIPMRGASSYCGGLWLAALSAGAALADACGDKVNARTWRAMLESGRAAFDEKLWAGTHYRVDTDGPMQGALFLEQLFGPFLARRYGLGDIVPETRACTALA